MTNRFARPWMFLVSVWIAAAVFGSIAGCPGSNPTATVSTAPTMVAKAPPKKTPKNDGKPQVDDQAPLVAVGEAFQPRKFTEAEEAKLQPGLALHFLSGSGVNATALDARGVRLAALHVPSGTPHSTMLNPGPFHAVLTGLIKRPLDGEFGFKVVGTGNAVLFINNKQVATLTNGTEKPSGVVPMLQGYNKIDVAYASPVGADATLRVYWKSDDKGGEFGWEPVPPNLLKARSDDAGLSAGQNQREGRLLFATMGCAQCHGLPGGLTADKCKMPEIKQQAPSLENAGRRFDADWLAEWIFDPSGLRPEATMPHLLQGPDDVKYKQAADLAAYVGSLKVSDPLPKTQLDEEASTEGKKIFENLGCIACHHLEEPDPEQQDKYQRMSLAYVAAKFQPGALENYLRRPLEYHAWSRMPDFKLTPQEARQLTNFLLDNAEGEVEVGKFPLGDAKVGEKLFASVGCAQCHLTGENPALPKPSTAFPKVATKGCLADDAAGRGKAPEFDLDSNQKAGLRAFLATDGSSLTRETPAEFSLRQMKLLQCNSCHTRDSVVSRYYSVVHDETGMDPVYLPHLTWTGEKLHVEWTEKLLSGLHTQSARPWLTIAGIRMPTFPTRASLLPSGLSHEHGFSTREDLPGLPDPKLAKIGEELIPQTGGLFCIQCHDVGKEKAIQPFGNDGINLLDAGQRLRYEFYMRWMINPARVDETAKMPKFPPVADVLDGNSRAQFDAIWQYMQTLPEMQTGPGKER